MTALSCDDAAKSAHFKRGAPGTRTIGSARSKKTALTAALVARVVKQCTSFAHPTRGRKRAMAKLKQVRALKSSGVEPLTPALIKRIQHGLVLNGEDRRWASEIGRLSMLG
jgi:hypothetical protein